MLNKFCKVPLYECSSKLALVAQGKIPADMVILNSTLVNVCTHELLEKTDVAIAFGRIAMIGDCKHCIGEKTKVYYADGKYLAPAFLDSHIHVESSMMTCGEYAKAVIPHGTSGIFMDPHEICNVLGLDGVKCMLDDSKRTPLKTMLTTPSCVPAVPGFEDSGAVVDENDIKETMNWDECVGLGEMMNFPGVLSGNNSVHAIIDETLKAGKIVTGHYSIPETGMGLNAYIASGARCCHESTRFEDALQKMRLGMYALFREGSAWHDLKEVAKAITQHKIDTRFACLISDDTHPSTLFNYGHLDHIVRRAIEEGIDPITAIQMVTINPAQLFTLDNELGSVTPSKCADLVLLDDLNKCIVNEVFIDGKLVAQNGKVKIDFKPYIYPYNSTHSMHLDKIDISKLQIKAIDSVVNVRVIEVIPARVGTYEKIETLKVVDGLVNTDVSKDILKAAVFERHKNTGTYGLGFVKGFQIKNGALAQTIAHDAHNLLVIGSNDEDMVLAVNTLIDCGGGMVVVQNGNIKALVELPVGGLMSELSLEKMVDKVEKIETSWKDMGCNLPSPFMTMALISLACLPELRLTNRGLVDCQSFKFVNLIVK